MSLSTGRHELDVHQLVYWLCGCVILLITEHGIGAYEWTSDDLSASVKFTELQNRVNLQYWCRVCIMERVK